MGTYVSPTELRTFLQFDAEDFPVDADIDFFIKIGDRRLTLDLDTANENILFVASLLLSKYYLLRGLATKAVRKGYIQVEVEGRTITKAYQEFVLEAENVFQEYKEFIVSTNRQEATSTQYFANVESIDTLTRQDILDIMTGVNDVTDLQQSYSGRRFR